MDVDVDVDAAEDDDEENVLTDAAEAFVEVGSIDGDKGADFWIDNVLDDTGCVDVVLNWARVSVVVGSRCSLRPATAALSESRMTTCSVTITTSTTEMLAFFLSLTFSSVTAS